MAHTSLRTPADIGALIKARRLALGLDQAGLANRADVSRLWINQVERGKPGASLGLILRTLLALGIQLTGETADSGRVADPAVTGAADIDAIVASARQSDRK
jgi:HTH-type transcriptional regulator/antitoxin HipB